MNKLSEKNKLRILMAVGSCIVATIVYFLVFDCTGLSLDVSFLWLRGAGATLCFGVVASLVVAHRLERAGSGVVMHSLVALQHMGASCIGIKPMSAALAGRFLTTRPLWKPPYLNLFDMF